MEKIVTLLTVLWAKVRVANARVIAHIFSRYSSKSSPAICGEETFYFETYSPSIQKLCDKWGISNSTHQAKEPGRFAKWFLSMFLGWPWPIRMLVYKGKRLDAVATSPEEMARLIHKVWDSSIAKQKIQREDSHKLQSESVAKPRAGIEDNRREIATAKTIKRIVNPINNVEQNNEIAPTESSFPYSSTQIKEDSKKIVEGAIFDNSF